jgi:hypothetical protein
MSLSASQRNSCLNCGKVKLNTIEFDRNLLSVCSGCGFSERTYSGNSTFYSSQEVVAEKYFVPTATLEKCAQNKGYKFSGVSNSWLPMEKWGRWIGEAGRATITFQLEKPIEKDAILKVIFVMPDGHLPAPLVLTLEDREILNVTLSGSTEYFFELPVPNCYIAEKIKVDLNIYCEKLTKDEKGRNLSVGLKDIAFGLISDNTSYQEVQFNEGTLPFVKDEVQFRRGKKSTGFDSTVAEVISGNLSCYPPEEFGIWLNTKNCEFSLLVPGDATRVVMQLASPVIKRRGIATINDICKVDFVFDENFIEVEMKLDGSRVENSELVLDVRLEFDEITNMSELGSVDEREISAGIAAIYIRKD